MKRILFILTILISIFIINNLVRSIYSLWNKQDVLVSEQKQISLAKKKNQQLKQQLSHVQDQQFVEEEARDKLMLVKPNEEIVLVPTTIIKISEVRKAAQIASEPHWKQWIALFL